VATSFVGVVANSQGGESTDDGPLPNGAVLRLGSSALRTGQVFSPIAISHDGRLIASELGRSSIAIWETATGKRLQTLTPKEPLRQELALTFSPRGDQMAVVSNLGSVDIWDTASGRLVHSVPAESREKWERSAVAYSDDGKLLAFATNSYEESEVVVVRTSDWKQIQLLKALGYSYLDPLRVSGKRVIAWSGREVVTWDIESGEIVHTFETRPLEEDAVLHETFLSPDGSLMAVNTEEDVRVKGVADETWRPIDANSEYRGPLAFSFDNRTVAVESAKDHSVRLIDLASGDCAAELQGATVRIHKMEFSRDGDYLAASSGLRHLVWNLRERKLVPSCVGPEVPIRLAFSPNDSLLCTEDAWDEFLHKEDRGTPAVRVWSAESGKCLWSVDGARQPLFLPDGDGIAMIEGNRLVAYSVGSDMRRWSREMETLKEDEPRTVPTFDGEATIPLDIRRLAMSSDGSRFVYDVGGWRLAVYDRPKDQIRFVEPEGDERLPPFGLAVSPANNDHVLVGHLLFDVETGKVVARYPSRAMLADDDPPEGLFPIHRTPGDIAFDHAGKRVAVLDWDIDEARQSLLTVDLYSADSHELLDTRIVQKQEFALLRAFAPASFTLSPDGRFAALVGDDSRVHVFDTASAKDVAQLPAQPAYVLSIAFAHDGKRLATGMSDTTVLIWDLKSLGIDESER
jgi:WD40 repeat protein